jgi:hypothetical protein
MSGSIYRAENPPPFPWHPPPPSQWNVVGDGCGVAKEGYGDPKE